MAETNRLLVNWQFHRLHTQKMRWRIKFLVGISNSSLKYGQFATGDFRAFSYSNHNSAAESRFRDTLYGRLCLNPNPKLSLIPVIDKWVSQGKPVYKGELVDIIRIFRNHRRTKHALEISEWMDAVGRFDISSRDVLVRLNLISQVHGIDQSETYFNTLPDSLRSSDVYGALLDSYVNAKFLEKAEDIMKKISTMDSATTLTCNGMLNLYSQLGKRQKLESLRQDMEDKGIPYNRYTYSVLLNAYSTFSDIKRLEKLLMKMEMDPLISVSFHFYAAAAKGYLKTGDIEKTLIMLIKAEQLIEHHEKKFCYEFLLTMYANMGKKVDVHRIWNHLKRLGRPSTTSYLSVLSSLEKVDDLDSMERLVKECEENSVYFDIRVPNFLIRAYCTRGDIKRAESIIKGLVDCGRELNGSTWSSMATGYCKIGHIEEAVKMMKKAIGSSSPGWKPHRPTFARCLEYLKLNGYTDQVDEIIKSLEQCQLSSGSKKRLFWFLENGYNTDRTPYDNTRGTDQFATS